MTPELSDPKDCDIIFAYLGNNNFCEVKMHSTLSDRTKVSTKSHGDDDDDWKPK